MLKISIPRFYKVRKNQTLRAVAEAFSVPETRIVADNNLHGEIEEGQILILPRDKGNLYVVRAGDTKELLCGGKENYRKKKRNRRLLPRHENLDLACAFYVSPCRAARFARRNARRNVKNFRRIKYSKKSIAKTPKEDERQKTPAKTAVHGFGEYSARRLKCRFIPIFNRINVPGRLREIRSTD